MILRTEIILKPLSLQHLEDLVRLDFYCFRTPLGRALLRDVLTNPQGYHIGAFIHNHLIGALLSVTEQKEIQHIVFLAVHPEYRKRGIGQTLLKTCLNEISRTGNVKSFKLEVKTTNFPAIFLYQKLGFVKLNTIRNYYEDNSDAYFMLKKIQDTSNNNY